MIIFVTLGDKLLVNICNSEIYSYLVFLFGFKIMYIKFLFKWENYENS